MATDLDMLRTLIARGLGAGIGDGETITCVEGAIALASGEGLTDEPSCAHEVDRAWAIGINDAGWSTPQARAEALLPIALAQIGTAGTDRRAWAEAVVLGTTRRVLPVVLREAGFHEHAASCEGVTDLAGALDATRSSATVLVGGYAGAAAADAQRAVISVIMGAIVTAVDHAARAVAWVDNDDATLRLACEVTLDAYRAEGRTP